MTEDDTLGEVLQHEASIYNHLSDLQGFVIPTFLGLFRAGGCSLLITADCGQSLTSFSTLSNAEWYVLFWFIITYNWIATSDQLMNHAVHLHEHGVLHNDFEPRNVVISGGKLKVIDFGMAELGHDCSGPSSCISLRTDIHGREWIQGFCFAGRLMSRMIVSLYHFRASMCTNGPTNVTFQKCNFS